MQLPKMRGPEKRMLIRLVLWDRPFAPRFPGEEDLLMRLYDRRFAERVPAADGLHSAYVPTDAGREHAQRLLAVARPINNAEKAATREGYASPRGRP